MTDHGEVLAIVDRLAEAADDPGPTPDLLALADRMGPIEVRPDRESGGWLLCYGDEDDAGEEMMYGDRREILSFVDDVVTGS